MKYGLTEAQLQTILSILAKHADIEEAVLFGSRAMGTYKEASDIDIAIKGENLAAKTAGTVKLQMEDTYLPFFVDVVDYTRIDNPAFIEHIDSKGVSIYRKGWQEYILEDAVEKFIDYRGKTPPKTDAGIPLVTAKIVKNGAIQTPSEFISEETYDQWMTRGFPKQNDVVLTTEAPLGEVALLKDENVALAQRIILMRGKAGVLNNGFLKYYFQSRDGQHLLQSRASGTTVFGIKAAVLKKIPITIPPLPEQEAITAVLASLDDKIDLLHRQNKTLEALAQTLFRHWFIDGAEDDWEEYQLGEFVEVTRGLSYKGAGLTEEGSGIPMHNLNSVYRGGGYKYEGIKFYAGEYKLKHLVKPRDIIVVNTDLTQDLALIGCPAIVPMSYGSEGLFSHHLYRLEITDARISQQFLYYLLLSYGVREQLTGATNGTTVTMLPKDGIEWAVFSLPQQSLIRRFSEMAQQYWDKKEANYAQIRTLEKLRDTLLPKLMSGEVRVDL